jgi:hypothetical protein
MKPDFSFIARVAVVVGILITTGSLLLPQRIQNQPVSAKTIDSAIPEPTARESLPTTHPEPMIHSPAQPALTSPSEPDSTLASPHPDAVAFGSDKISPTLEPQILLSWFEIYREHFGQFPAGEDNAQFMNALRGLNPERLAIFPFAHPRLDASGALLDAWGNPFFVHQLSRDHVEVRSAGPDGEWYTPDDLMAPRRSVVRHDATP